MMTKPPTTDVVIVAPEKAGGREHSTKEEADERWDEEAHAEVFYKAPLPPLAVADVMDCFRLYFGSNVTVFPFYAARLGAIGIIAVVCGAIALNLMTQSSLHRTRYNLAVLELRRRIDSYAAAAAAAGLWTGGQAAGEAFMLGIGMAPPLSSASAASGHGCVEGSSATEMSVVGKTAAPLPPPPGTPTPTSSASRWGFASAAEAALARNSPQMSHYTPSAAATPSSTVVSIGATAADTASFSAVDPRSDMVGYTLRAVGSLAKLSRNLWPDHWLKKAITVCIVVAQFFGSCGFVMLLANNVAPALGVPDIISVYLSALAMGLLTMDTSNGTKTKLAYANNLFILSGAALLLYASLAHEQTEEEKQMSLQIFPKSIAEFAMYAPSVVSYVAPQLVTIDAETVLAERLYKMHYAPSSSSTSSMESSSLGASSSHRSGSAALSTPATTVSATSSSSVAFPSTPFPLGARPDAGFPSSPLAMPTLGGKEAFTEALTARLGTAVALQRCFRRALFVGAGISMLVLVSVAELIMWCFKDNTNAVIALSFPESTLRMTILLCLCVGLYACGALNVGPICDVLDAVAASVKAMADWHVLLQRLVARILLFGLVVVFLYLVPFFDLVAALSSAISTPLYVFFIPALCELQSEMLKAAERKGTQRNGRRADFALTGDGVTPPTTPAGSPTIPVPAPQTPASPASHSDAAGDHLSAGKAPPTFFRQEDLSVMDGWRGMPLFSKALAIASVTLGSTILSFSTYTVIGETIRRRAEGGI